MSYSFRRSRGRAAASDGLSSVGCFRSAEAVVAARKKSWRLDGMRRTVSATGSMFPPPTLSHLLLGRRLATYWQPVRGTPTHLSLSLLDPRLFSRGARI